MPTFVELVFRGYGMYLFTKSAFRRYLARILLHKGKSALVFAIALAFASYFRKRLRPFSSRRVDAPRSPAVHKKKEASTGAQLSKIFKIVLPSLATTAGKHIIGMAVLTLLRTSVNDKIAHIQGNLFRAVFLKEPSIFVRLIIENILANFATSTIQSSLEYITRKLTLIWQKKLTDKIARSYFSSLTYYRLAFVDKRIPDPEQVFTSDLPQLVDGMSDITLDVLKSISDGVYFTYRVFSEIGMLCSNA